MQTNIGTVDKALRVLTGTTLLGLVNFGPASAWGWIGLLPLLTAATGCCPLYRAFGVSTHRTPARSD